MDAWKCQRRDRTFSSKPFPKAEAAGEAIAPYFVKRQHHPILAQNAAP